MRRLPLGILICALLALALAGCVGGSGDDASASGNVLSATGPASATPADSLLYVEALVQPTGDVRDGVAAAARKVLLGRDLGTELRKLIESALREDQPRTSFERDIEPWLGERAGLFLLAPEPDESDPHFALVVAARDRDALLAELKRQRRMGQLRPGGTYRGVAYYIDKTQNEPNAAVGDFLVLASSLPGLRAAVDAWKDGSLVQSARFKDALAPLADDTLAYLYADPREISKQLLVRDDLDDFDPMARQLLESDAIAKGEPVTVGLTARADEIVLESSATSDLAEQLSPDADGPQLSLADVPGDAWLAFSAPPLGPLIRMAIDSEGDHDTAAESVREVTGLDLDADLLEPLGGLSGFARGTGPLNIGGGLMLRMTDEAAAQKLLTSLRTLAAGSGAEVNSVAGGFELEIPQLPQPIVVLADGDRIAAGYAASSAKDLLDPQEPFDESSAGKAAIETLGDGYTPSVVVLAPPIVDLLRSLDEIELADFSDVLPYLAPYRSIAAGTKRDGDRTTVRVVVTLK